MAVQDVGEGPVGAVGLRTGSLYEPGGVFEIGLVFGLAAVSGDVFFVGRRVGVVWDYSGGLEVGEGVGRVGDDSVRGVLGFVGFGGCGVVWTGSFDWVGVAEVRVLCKH